MKNFSKINSVDELKRFLRGNAKKHEYLYHFTTLKTLSSILRNRTFRFSNASLMNDLHEYQKKCNTNTKYWDNIFSMCFSHGDEDSMAMWAMYGIPWENAVCIAIRAKELYDWFIGKVIKQVGYEPESHNAVKFIENKSSMHDICYYAGYIGTNQFYGHCAKAKHGCQDGCQECPKHELHWDGKKIESPTFVEQKEENTGHVFVHEDLVGFVKNSAWEHEKETRLMLWVDDSNLNIANNKIDVELPTCFIEKMRIILGPRNTGNLYQLDDFLSQCSLDDNVRETLLENATESYFKQGNLLSQLKRHCDIDHRCSVTFPNLLKTPKRLKI